tara:strand:+ start:7409 stop:7738 length:330 start_codon:yes stop_codon:yes gene_type:complete
MLEIDIAKSKIGGVRASIVYGILVSNMLIETFILKQSIGLGTINGAVALGLFALLHHQINACVDYLNKVISLQVTENIHDLVRTYYETNGLNKEEQDKEDDKHTGQDDS